MDKQAKDTFAFDLENRLDDFFSDSLSDQAEPPADDVATSEPNQPLRDLKSTILAIDWEITDESLSTFLSRVAELMERFESDKVVSTLLKILTTLGKYIRSHKSNAHPDTIKRIMAVYAALERSLADNEISPHEKEHLLAEEIKQFKLFKAQIVQSKSSLKKDSPQKTVTTAKASDLDAVIRAIEALKSMMAIELGAIRKELGQLRRKSGN